MRHLAILACTAGTTLGQVEVGLDAIDTDSIRDVDGNNLADNRFRAYTSPNDVDRYDSYAKFDLSGIPDDATISEATLTVWHEQGFGNPFNDPVMRVYRCEVDSWSNANPNDPYPGLDEVLTDDLFGFPGGDLIPVEIPLDAGAFDWSIDLADDTLTLAIHNENDFYSYVYFYGAQGAEPAPHLDITYDDCLADCNGDGALDILDFVCFQGLFLSGDAAADCDGDGSLTVLDFVCFQQAFQAGCP